MLPASNRGPGQALGFPDVCLTPAPPAPPVPVPYPNIAMNAQAAPFSPTVKVNMMNALNQMSQIPMSSGDEAGAAHPMMKGPQRYTMGCPNVFVDGAPAITLASLTNHNNMNCPIGAVLVPSAVNVTFSRATATERAPRAIDPRATRSLGALEVADLADAACGESLRATVDGTVGRVHFSTFAASAGAELFAALRRLVALGAHTVEIDLRGCGGGTLEGALDAASTLLPDGAPLVELVEPDGDVTLERVRFGAMGDLASLPVTVHVDRATASAAEAFAAALLANERAPILGGPTYGKAVAHRLDPSLTGDARLTAALRFRTASGAEIDGVGVGG
jgi:carboxyl-terminal processing protease